MISLEQFRKLSLAFQEAAAAPHFEKESFRVRKKIFATLDTGKKIATVKLSPLDQSVFCSYDSTVIYPVAGGWGRQGWTHINLGKIKKAMLVDILTVAYCSVAPVKLADLYRKDKEN